MASSKLFCSMGRSDVERDLKDAIELLEQIAADPTRRPDTAVSRLSSSHPAQQHKRSVHLRGKFG